MSLQSALTSFEAKVKAFFSAEITIAEAIGETMVHGVEIILTAVEPTAVADVKAILQGIDSAFLKGSTLADIAEEVLNAAAADTKAIISALQPQVLESIIGVLIQAL